MTRNHDYNTPNQGISDWHVPINDNFEKFDTDIEIRDTEANLESYTPKAGAKFFATDTENVYLGDGSSWNGVASSGKQPTFNSVRPGELTNSIGDAKIQAGWDGLVVPIAKGLGMSDAIQPSSTSTPIQDAINVVASAGGGEVKLPAGTVTENDTISMKSDVKLIGRGENTSGIEITATGVPGIEFNDKENDGEPVKRAGLDGFQLVGPGSTATTGPAIVHKSHTEDLTVGDIIIMSWHDAAYKIERGALPFQLLHDRITIFDTDAGDTTNEGSMFSGGALIQCNAWSPGPANYFNLITAYPVATASNNPSRVIYSRGGHLNFNTLNLGGTVGEVAALNNDACTHIGYVNWEPHNAPANPTHLIRCAGNKGYKKIDNVVVATGTTDYIYEVSRDTWNGNDAGRIRLGPVQNTSTINNNIVEVTGEVTDPAIYEGVSTEIDQNSGTNLTQPVAALGDLTPVS